MSYLLEEPRTVLVVTPDETLVNRVRQVLLESAVSDVVGAEDWNEAENVLESSDNVGCVVLGDGLSESLVTLCDRVHDHDTRLPVVVFAAEDDASLASEVTAAGAFAYVLQFDDDRLTEAVTNAIGVYERRRRHYERNSMFETLLTELDSAIYAKDEHARHVLKGSNAGDLKPERFIGKTDVDVYGESETSLESLADDMQVIEEGDPIDGKVTSFEAPDGTHWSETTKVPWVDDGTVKGLMGITRDITEDVKTRHRLENHREQMAEFTEYVTHDLRNPLQVAAGAIELARQTDDEQQLDRAARAIERAGEIIDDLGDHIDDQVAAGSQVEHATTDVLMPERIQIDDLVDDVWELIAEEGGVCECLFAEEATVTAQSSSLRPVVENLLSNAVRHGGDPVAVRVGPLDTGGFYVADDGPGIPEEDRERVLEKGYTTASEGSGTGLGLVGSIADREGWHLDITESEAGGAQIEIHNCPTVARPTLGALDGDSVTVGEELSLESETDVGPVNIQGDAGYDAEAGRWYVSGGGQNIYHQTNEFHYLHTSVDSPFRIEGQVTGVEDVTEWSTGALLVRSSLDEDAAYGGIGLSSSHGTAVYWRPEPGADGVSYHFENTSMEQPWVRLVRIGGTVTTLLSTDGEQFHAIDQRQVDLDETVQVGLAVCSNQTNQLCSATFEHLAVNRLQIE